MGAEKEASSTASNRGRSARELLAEVDPASASVIAGLDEDAPLLDAGVDSAQIVELALLLEERFGGPLGAGELDRLVTLRSIDGLLRDRLGRA